MKIDFSPLFRAYLFYFICLFDYKSPIHFANSPSGTCKRLLAWYFAAIHINCIYAHLLYHSLPGLFITTLFFSIPR